MKLLFLIGNGFDINLGLKTSYQDFYNYYRSVENNDPDISLMKNSIEKGRYAVWSDLEYGLGKFSSELNSSNVFLKCLTDIKENLSHFLDIQYRDADLSFRSDTLLDSLSNPEKHLDSFTLRRYSNFVKQFYSSTSNVTSISVVTFNYTRTMEDVLSSGGIYQIPVLHIHGQLGDSIAMGVNDLEQIENLCFHDDRDVLEDFIKPEYNDACLNDNNLSFESKIMNADVIILYGLSLGETDRKWWRLIGERLTSSVASVAGLLYFPYDKKKDPQKHPNHRRRWTEEYQQLILNKLAIPEENSESVANRIFIGINRDIFLLSGN